MTAHQPEDPLDLTPRPIPPEVCRVQGCTCGGIEWHHTGCSIFDLPEDQAAAAVDDARQRMLAYSAERTRNLHAALAALTTDPRSAP